MQLLVEKQSGIAIVSINRPERSNGLTDDMLAELSDLITEFEADTDVHAVVLTGTGSHFSSGFDLKQDEDGSPPQGMSPEEFHRATVRRHAEQLRETLWKIWRSPLPFVGAVHRLCLGGAVYLTAVMDVVLVTPDAEIGMSELRFGLAPPMFNIFPWIMSYRHAKEFLLTGDVVSGERAVEIGLATATVSETSLLSDAVGKAQRIAAMPDGVSTTMKQSVNRRWELSGLVEEIEHQLQVGINNKIAPGEFQIRFRELVAAHGVEHAIDELGIELGLRKPYIGQ